MTDADSFGIDKKTLNSIIIFCDGACSGNPGPGGWGSIVVYPGGEVQELGSFKPSTTNNQMELEAVSGALMAIRDVQSDVIIYTDSVYVIRGITQWIWGWRKRGWISAAGNPVANKDHWEKLNTLVINRKKYGSLSWKFVKGHSGVPGNERCDEIAVGFTHGRFVQLYRGSILKYDVPILDLPPDVPLPEMKPKTETKAAFSYLSYLGGTAMRHSNWSSCEKRVKGQSGAKFKKAMSEEDEIVILDGWGIRVDRVKSE